MRQQELLKDIEQLQGSKVYNCFSSDIMLVEKQFPFMRIFHVYAHYYLIYNPFSL